MAGASSATLPSTMPAYNSFTGDVCFLVEGNDQLIEAHRSILASKSTVFKAILLDKNTGIIHISGFSTAVVTAAVNFMYTGKIKFNDEVPSQDVLAFAHQYQIQWLRDLCEADLVGSLDVEILDVENLFEMLSISYRCEAETLKGKALLSV